MDYIQAENVYELIKNNKSGFFELSDSVSGYKLCFYPISNDFEDAEMTKKASSVQPAELCKKLQEQLEHLGPGKYKIRVRPNAKASLSELTYFFTYKIDNQFATNQQVNGLGAMPNLIDVEAKILSGVENFKKEWLKEQAHLKKIEELEKQLAEAKKPKAKKVENTFNAKKIQMLIGLAGTTALPFIKQHKPEVYNDALGMLNKVLDFDLEMLEDEEETEDTEHEEIKFERPTETTNEPIV